MRKVPAAKVFSWLVLRGYNHTFRPHRGGPSHRNGPGPRNLSGPTWLKTLLDRGSG